MSHRGIIVGYDPGITTAISILDTHGKIVSLVSKRNIGKGEIVKYISRFGKPLIVSTDKNPLPRSVEKLASTFSSKVSYPEISMSVIEKQQLAKETDIVTKNDHEIDALAASIKAWRKYKGLSLKVERSLNEIGLMEFYDDVLAKLIREESGNINNAINELGFIEWLKSYRERKS